MGWVKTEKTNKLSKLGDIDFTTTAPVDGNALVYDETNNVWVPGEGGGGSSGVELTQAEYDQLTQEEKNNGTIYQISDKGYFYYKEKQFRAVKELTQAQYDALTPAQKADGTIYMISDATNNLDDLDNVDITNLTNGQIIEYDATTQSWVNATNNIVIQKTQAEYDLLTSAEKNNGSIYKITDKAKIYCLDEEYHAIKEITSVNYAQLTSDEKNNGTLYVITDEETTANDIAYSAGVSVADKLDNVPTFDTLTTSDNNKLLGVSVSGSDISVGAVSEGTGIDITSNTVSLDIDGLTSVSSLSGTDEIAVYDGTSNKKTTVSAVAAADYTITTSTDSSGVNWTVKKYNSGDMEIWANKNYTPSQSISFTGWGSMYYVQFNSLGSYPEAFYSMPCVIGQVQIDAIDTISSITGPSNKNSAPRVIAVTYNAATIATKYNIHISIYAKGRWKA